MAATPITPQAIKGPYPTLPVAANALDLSTTAADAANGNKAAFGSYSKLLLVWHNTGAGARTVTLTSVADAMNRTGDVTAFSIGAGERGGFLFERSGWSQPSGVDAGSVLFSGEHAEVLFIVIGI